jgi:hypothetical protein
MDNREQASDVFKGQKSQKQFFLHLILPKNEVEKLLYSSLRVFKNGQISRKITHALYDIK